MDPKSPPSVVVETPKNPAVKNLNKTLGEVVDCKVCLEGPITPDSDREGESSADSCSTPEETIFNPTVIPSPPAEDDGFQTPKGSVVFDPFAPCETCPPTPGPVIPQRIRLG